MAETRGTFAFRWLLPLMQIVVCAIVLWPFRAMLIHEVRSTIQAYEVPKATPTQPSENEQHGLIINIDPRDILTFETFERRLWVPMILNLPAILVELPYAAFSPNNKGWIPRGMDFRTWRAISWPFIGILFWWSAGRGLEALVATRRRLSLPRISWIETVVGASLFLFCSVAMVCVPLFAGGDDAFPYRLWVVGSGVWAVLGGIVLAARIAQWRLRKRDRTGTQPAPAG